MINRGGPGSEEDQQDPSCLRDMPSFFARPTQFPQRGVGEEGGGPATDKPKRREVEGRTINQ